MWAPATAQFLAGWLLPHGAIEIPAILLGGQAGFVLAGALIGWGERASARRTAARRRARSARHRPGRRGLLVWAGIVEAFVSQYHQPVLPYGAQDRVRILEMAALSIFLARVGRA